MKIMEMLKKYWVQRYNNNEPITMKGELGFHRSIEKCINYIGIVHINELNLETNNLMIGFYKSFTKCKNNSINKLTSYMKAALRYFKYLDHPFLLVQLLKKDTKHVKPISREGLIDIIRIVDAMNSSKNSHVYRGLIHLLYATGARIFEFLKVKKEDVDIKHREILITKSKTKKERFVFYTEYQDQFIKELMDNPSEYLFYNHIRKRKLNFENDVRNFTRRLKKKLDENITIRQFRKTMATDFARASEHDILTLQYILGHEDIGTTRIYVDLRKEDAEKKYKKISEKLVIYHNQKIS